MVIAGSGPPFAGVSHGRNADRTHDRFQEVVETLASHHPEDTMLVTSHGDFAPRNVIDGPSGLRLIDFDRLQRSSPARDLCYSATWIWATSLMVRGRGDWTEGSRLLDHYADLTDRHLPDPELAFYRIAALIRVAHGWSVLAHRPDIVELLAIEAEQQCEAVRGVTPSILVPSLRVTTAEGSKRETGRHRPGESADTPSLRSGSVWSNQGTEDPGSGAGTS